MMVDAGQVVLCSFIAPQQEMRDFARSLMPEGQFSEVWVQCDLGECRKRDTNGLYERADKGEIPNFTGVSAPYEEPTSPDLVLNTEDDTVEQSVANLVAYLNQKI